MTAASSGSWKTHVVSALLFGLFQVGLFAPVLLSGDTFLPVSPKLAPPWARAGELPSRPQDGGGTDKVVYTLPNLVHWTRAARGEGASIHWNPDILCGYPFLAAQDTFALYPLNVIHLVCGPVQGLLISALVHGWLACFLAWLVLLRLGTGFSGARVGALVYGASGWFLAHLDVVNFAQAAAWIPLMLWGGLELVQRGRFRGVLALAGGFLLSFLGGMAQVTFIGLFITGVVTLGAGLFQWRERGTAVIAGSLGKAFVGVIFGVLLAAPQLLPTAEYAERATRTAMTGESLSRVSMRPAELTGVLFPELLGNPAEFDRLHRIDPGGMPAGVTESNFPPAVAADLPATGASFMERVFYPGAAALFLFLLAFAGMRRHAAVWAVALVVGGLAAAMDSPVQRLLTQLPMFSFGNPRRFLLLTIMGLSFGAALGMQAVRQRRLPILALWGSGLVLLVPLLLAASRQFALKPSGWADGEQMAALHDWVIHAALWPCLLFLGSGLMIWAFNRRSPLSAWLPIGIMVLMVFDLGLLNHRINPGQPAEESNLESQLGEWLKAHPPSEGGRVVRFRDPQTAVSLHAPLPPNLGLLVGVRDFQGYEGLVDGHVEDYMALIDPDLVHERHLVQEITDRSELDSPLLDLAAVRYVITSSILDLPRLHANLVEQVAVHERATALPRIRLAARLAFADGESDVLRTIGGATFNPVDDVVVTTEAAVKLIEVLDLTRPAQDGALHFDTTSASIEVLQDEATLIRVRYSLASSCVLHVADSWDPNWEAELEDGRQLPVVPANHLFRAIPLPAGDGVLTLRYVPRSFLRGLYIAGVGLILLVAWGILLLIRAGRVARSED